MAMNTTKVSELEVTSPDNVSENANVLIEEDGVAKKIPVNEFGGMNVSDLDRLDVEDVDFSEMSVYSAAVVTDDGEDFSMKRLSLADHYALLAERASKQTQIGFTKSEYGDAAYILYPHYNGEEGTWYMRKISTEDFRASMGFGDNPTSTNIPHYCYLGSPSGYTFRISVTNDGTLDVKKVERDSGGNWSVVAE